MSDMSNVQQRNEELAKRINDEARRDPQSPYAGKFVGLADGQVAIVGDDFDPVVRHLLEVCPDPARTFVIEAGLDYDAVVMIWRVF